MIATRFYYSSGLSPHLNLNSDLSTSNQFTHFFFASGLSQHLNLNSILVAVSFRCHDPASIFTHIFSQETTASTPCSVLMNTKALEIESPNIIGCLVRFAEILHQSPGDRKTVKERHAKRDEFLAAARQLLESMDPSSETYDIIIFDTNKQ